MLSLLLNYRAIKQGMVRLRSVQHDRDATLSMLAEARATNAPADLTSQVIIALGMHHSGEEVLAALEDVLVHDRSKSLRSAACVALGQMKDPRARELLDRAATSDPTRKVRWNARENRDHPGQYPGAFAPLV